MRDRTASTAGSPYLQPAAIRPGVSAEVRALLDVERDRTRDRIASLISDLDDIVAGLAHSNVDDEHDPEGSTVAFERARVAALLEQDRAYLAAIEEAFQREASGAYGLCERCGDPIPPERLTVLPAARYCIRCC